MKSFNGIYIALFFLISFFLLWLIEACLSSSYKYLFLTLIDSAYLNKSSISVFAKYNLLKALI